jgi:glucan phosphoethanolaminetransferase (alkaline phosphatase superfamily)
METVKIEKKEYKRLLRVESAYKKIVGEVYNSKLNDSVNDVIKDFDETKLYTADFLKDLSEGLKKSSYLNKKK